jgi:hypothetical protein
MNDTMQTKKVCLGRYLLHNTMYRFMTYGNWKHNRDGIPVKSRGDQCYVLYLCKRMLLLYLQVQMHLVARRIPKSRKVYAFLPEHMSWPTIFSGVCVLRSLVFCVVFCRSLFVLLSLVIWSLYLSIYDFLLHPFWIE